MKTDTIFYRIMQTAPSLLFELWGDSAEVAQDYEFRAVEIKQLAFRLDGVFLPKPDARNQTVVFVEVQFQDDPRFYQRFFGEIFLFLAQHPETVNWRAVVLFSDRGIEPEGSPVYDVLLESAKVQRIYLEDFTQAEAKSLGIGMMQLIMAKPAVDSVVQQAKVLMEQTRRSVVAEREKQAIIELLETVVIYKFPMLSREEIEKMLGLGELRQTKVYQEALQEGRQEGRQEGLEQERSLILRQLTRRVGIPSSEIRSQVESLPLEQLESLGEALLDFSSLSDLERWLRSRS